MNLLMLVDNFNLWHQKETLDMVDTKLSITLENEPESIRLDIIHFHCIRAYFKRHKS